MKTVTEHLFDHARSDLGFFPPKPMPSLDAIRKIAWSNRFTTLMQNRMIMGQFRYGLLHEQPGYDHVGEIVKRILMYKESGNQELLVDVANFALAEYITGDCHPAPHWQTVDDGTHMKGI